MVSFEAHAGRYWGLTCSVGGGRSRDTVKIHGQGCRLGPKLVLTAAHVVEGHVIPVTQLGSQLWTCSVAGIWQDRDIALLRAEELLRTYPGEVPDSREYPVLSSVMPRLGTPIGYLGALWLTDLDGKQVRRTYFGQGHVAFFELDASRPPLMGIEGSAVAAGFSGGPAFTASGDLTGVLVRSIQYVPDLDDRLPHVRALPLMSPIAQITAEITALVEQDRRADDLDR